MKTTLPLLVFSACLTGASLSPAEQGGKYYLFYLHGAIVENQGVHAVSDRFGAYEYEKIIARLGEKDIKVISEPRPQGTDVNLYADKTVKQINALIQSGVSANRITVVGASKGSLIAMLASTKLANPRVHFVLMANCNDWVMDNFSIDLTGDILSIYEKSDDIGKSCNKIKGNSSGVGSYKEIELNTGLEHGFIFRPLDEWVLPVLEWAKMDL